jgi:hypothetical protein
MSAADVTEVVRAEGEEKKEKKKGKSPLINRHCEDSTGSLQYFVHYLEAVT